MSATPSNHSSRVISEHTAKVHSPNGGLRAIRRNNGWDDDAHPQAVVREEFMSKTRVRAVTPKQPLRTYDSEFGSE